MDDNQKNKHQREGLPWRATFVGERTAMLEPSNRQLVIFFVVSGLAALYACTGNAAHFATIVAALSWVGGFAFIYLISRRLNVRRVVVETITAVFVALTNRVLLKQKDRQREREE